MYLTIIAQRDWMETQVYWNKKITQYGNLNPQEQMKRTRNGK